MKQILQSLQTGVVEVAEVPLPSLKPGHVLIRTSQTLLSQGTERMLLEFGKAGFVNKARLQPEKVGLVLDKIKTDGLQPTLEAVLSKLDQPLPLGYCNVGTVAAIESETSGFKVGERIVSNGQHAEVVSVPRNLCAKVPDSVSDEEAAFTVLAAIALQGIRLVQPTLGECVVVTGLGLVGLLTVQLLRAHGCRVLGLDFDKERLDLARLFGADVVDLSIGENPIEVAQDFSRRRGVDAVIVTAATKSSEPIHQAALMCRKRGRIVLVGVTGLELSRDDFFKKELTFQVSASYGPGRYDPNYEEKGNDYPIGFVRWTEQRNFEAVLDMMAEGQLDVKPLITHRFDISDANKAYELIGADESSLGILLTFPGIELSHKARTVTLLPSSPPYPSLCETGQFSVSFIGSGNYARALLIPAFKKAGAYLRIVASRSGVSGFHAGQKYGFELTTTSTDNIFTDTETNAVVISTQHDSHAGFVLQSLRAGKHVFVEKPLCLTLSDLAKIESTYAEIVKGNSVSTVLMVGFNRRFAPHVQKIKNLLKGVNGPKTFVMTVNAGAIPADHWTQNSQVGGGRIVGEACHFIDLLRFLAAAPIIKFSRSTMASPSGDTVSLTLEFEDGSIGTIHYFANGSKVFPKERLEVFVAGRVLQLDNFTKLKGYGWPGFKKMNLWRQDKGQSSCAAEFVKAASHRATAPIPFEEIVEVSRVSIELAEWKDESHACSS